MAYSLDLRKRVIAYRRAGHILEDTRQTFKIAINTIRAWEQKLREEGTLEAKVVVRSFRKVDPEKLKAYIAEHPDAYLREIAEVFNCCKTTITNALRRLKITRKKKTKHYKEQDPVKVAEYNDPKLV